MWQDRQQQNLAVHFVASFRLDLRNVKSEIHAKFLKLITTIDWTFGFLDSRFKFLTLRSLRTSFTVKFDEPALMTLVKSPLIRMFPALFSSPNWSIFSGSIGGSPISGMPRAKYGFRLLKVVFRHALSWGSLLLHLLMNDAEKEWESNKLISRTIYDFEIERLTRRFVLNNLRKTTSKACSGFSS